MPCITVRLFAGLRERAGLGTTALELPEGAVAGDVWALLDLGERPPGIAFAVNRAYASEDTPLADGDVVSVAGLDAQVFHTPGHSPGGVCLYVPDLGVLLSGDTLFHGGPGATGRSFSDFPTILDSIRERLLTLPAETRVLTGHGDETTVGAEAGSYDEWVARGH